MTTNIYYHSNSLYYLFGGPESSEPGGGMSDYIGKFEKIEDVQAHLLDNYFDWAEIAVISQSGDLMIIAYFMDKENPIAYLEGVYRMAVRTDNGVFPNGARPDTKDVMIQHCLGLRRIYRATDYVVVDHKGKVVYPSES